jgi:hypothetical protein
MKLLNSAEWLAHWGEERLAETITGSQRCYREMWEHRNDKGSLWSYPAWELCLGRYWEESLDAWHARWAKSGGKLYEGRMIAAKWDPLWESLSSTFYDDLGKPYPPYARSSCAYWMQIGQDEAIVTGVITESEFQKRVAVFPRRPLLDRDGKPISKAFLEQLKQGLEEDIYAHGGPRSGASRAERVAHGRQRWKESLEQARAEHERRNLKSDEEHGKQHAIFPLLEEVERALREQPVVNDKRRWGWLSDSLNNLTTTPYFDRYPNWKARTWLACAEMHRIASAPADELTCLKRALQFNPRLSVKRRIKMLEQSLPLKILPNE